MIEGDIFNHDKELPSLDEARTGPKALISKTQAWSVGIFPLGRLEAPLASRLFFFFATARPDLLPQVRKFCRPRGGAASGESTASCAFCARCIKTRCRAKLCSCCTRCPAARCAATVGTLGDQGLHTQLTTEINVLRVAHARRCAHCRTVLHGAQGNLWWNLSTLIYYSLSQPSP